jgi:hypothetical protein
MASDGRPEDVLDLLMQEHREVEDLLTGVRHAGSAPLRRERADQLIAALVRHSMAEETYVYPLVRDYLIHGEETLAHDRAEHAELRVILKEFEAADATDPRFMALVRDLQVMLARHIAYQQGLQFPQLRLAAPAHELVALRPRVQAIGRVAAGRTQPLSADGPPLVGPEAGMEDRLRDALAGPRAS